MCVTFVTCEVRVCGLRCRSGSSLYIYRVYFYYLPPTARAERHPRFRARLRASVVLARMHVHRAVPLSELAGTVRNQEVWPGLA